MEMKRQVGSLEMLLEKVMSLGLKREVGAGKGREMSELKLQPNTVSLFLEYRFYQNPCNTLV